jgi:hypothetical protein
MDLNIANVINITLTQTPAGLAAPSVNSIALFTTETPNNVDTYRTYLTAQDVITDYGTNSTTAKMASSIFAQSPNILSGDGRLNIIPLQAAVSATAGKITTPDLSSNLSAFLPITDGYVKITLNGTAINLTGLNFAGATTLADIAAVFQKKLQDVVVSNVGNTLVFTSKKVGSTSSIALATISGGSGTDLSGTGFLKASTSVAVAGTNASGETIDAAITRTYQQVQYVGIITNLEMEDAVLSSLATSMQARDMIFVHHIVSTEDIAGIATTIKSASNSHTRLFLYTNSNANLAKCSYVGRMFSVDFTGSNTTITPNLKVLKTTTPDPSINQTIKDNCSPAGVDCYISMQGVPCVVASKGNDYFDNVYNSLWFKFALQVAGFNYLYQTSSKVPQTESGMDGLKAAYRKVALQATINGMIGKGLAWNGVDTFGDPADFNRNISDYGFFIYSLPISQQSQVDREARKAPLIQMAVKLAGAIHKSDVLVIVQQ